MDSIRNATLEERPKAWNELLDPNSTFKFLYALSIIDSLQKQADFEAWKTDFAQLGGIEHLLYCLTALNLPAITSSIELRCIKELILLVHALYQNTVQASEHLPGKLIAYVDMVCQYSL